MACKKLGGTKIAPFKATKSAIKPCSNIKRYWNELDLG